MSQSAAGKALLSVDTGTVRLPVEIRDRDLLLLIRALGGEEINLQPGLYVVSAKLPGGGKMAETVVLASGERRSLALRPPEPPQTEVGRHLLGGRHPLGGRARDDRSRDLRLRFHRSDETAAVPPPAVSEFQQVGARWSVILQVASPGILAVQLSAPGLPDLDVALPAMGASSCRLECEVGEDDIVATALPVGGEVETAARYLALGSFREAADVLAATRDPLGAVLAGFVHLRLGESPDLPPRRELWPASFPDSKILTGELAARAGDHGSAVSHFQAAAEQGLPLFTDGYSILLSRLRQYTGQIRIADGPLDRLAERSLHVDFTALTLTFRGEGSPPDDGWIRLRDLRGAPRRRRFTTGRE